MSQTMIEDRRTVNTVQLKKQILRAFKLKRPLFVWGGPGIGKSKTGAQFIFMPHRRRSSAIRR